MSDQVRELRSLGWIVASHNDYLIKDGTRTYWLFTSPTGWVDGDGADDEEALNECLSKVKELEQE